MKEIGINLTPDGDINKKTHGSNSTKRLLTNLNETTMIIEEEKKFNSNFNELTDIQKNDIMEEIKKFINNENGSIIFINHIRSILVDRKHHNTFSTKSIEIINFLDFLAENNSEKLQEIYKKLNENNNEISSI